MKLSFIINIKTTVLLIICFLATNDKVSGQSIENLPQVKVQRASLINFKNQIELTGSIKANESIEVTSVISEKIKQIRFTEGSRVKKNEILIIFENNQEKAELKQVKAELDEANLNFERARELVDEGNASQSMLDKRLMQKKKLEGKYEEILAKLDDLTLKSPFKGIIGTKNYSEGSFIKPGDIIAKIYDIEKVKIELNIPEQYVSEIFKNQIFLAKIPSLKNEAFTGHIYAINPFIDSQTRTFKAIGIIMENKDFLLKPGMMVNIDLNLKSQEKIMIPEGSIIPVDDKRFIYKINKEFIVKKVEVLTGIRKDGLIEIMSGIEIGEMFVFEGTNKINSGKKVRVIE